VIKKIAIQKRTTRGELAAIVMEALRDALNDNPVLVGGAVVSIYTEGRYVSNDLDIVTYRDKKSIRPVMEKLGFVEEGSYWKHESTDLLIQFVNPPVMIGKRHVYRPTKMKTKAGEFATISPLESACDRLAWFLNGEEAALAQCVDLIVTKKITLRSIEEWLAGEDWPPSKKEQAKKTLKRMVTAARKRRK
jgi:hypothetical protein